MKKFKLALGALTIVVAFCAIAFVLTRENALVVNAKGEIARKELWLIGLNYLLMFIVIIPTFIALFVVAWKYRAKNTKAKHEPEKTHREWPLWVIPSIVIAVMTIITWYKTHELDPYVPLQNGKSPIKIQVVALDWKWLFIYPELGIATVNFVQFPAGTPVHFVLAADGSPMNAFWIPQLSGMIYAMAGMATQIHMIADEPGEYPGRAAELNGEGLADMTFVAKASDSAEFDAWVTQVKSSPGKLSHESYHALAQPSVKHPVELYSSVEEGLFDHIVMKYMYLQEAL